MLRGLSDAFASPVSNGTPELRIRNCYASKITHRGPVPRYYRHGRQDTRARFKAGAAKLKADRAARLEVELVIDRWNRRLATGRDMLWSPTIRAALVVGTPWLDVFCPGCGTSQAIDLRTVDRHPLASVAGGPPSGFGIITRAKFFTRQPAWRCLGAHNAPDENSQSRFRFRSSGLSCARRSGYP
jgi:hypothetical protein